MNRQLTFRKIARHLAHWSGRMIHGSHGSAILLVKHRSSSYAFGMCLQLGMCFTGKKLMNHESWGRSRITQQSGLLHHYLQPKGSTSKASVVQTVQVKHISEETTYMLFCILKNTHFKNLIIPQKLQKPFSHGHLPCDNKHTNTHTNTQTNQPTNQQTNKQTNKPTNQPTNKQTNKPTNQTNNQNKQTKTTNKQTSSTLPQSPVFRFLPKRGWGFRSTSLETEAKLSGHPTGPRDTEEFPA